MGIDWLEMQERVAGTLQDLIRFDTTNPPGNEIACATYIRDRLADEGVEAELIQPRPGRGNVVARLSGDGSERPLLLLSHLDVVPADSARWSVPPFEGRIDEGFVWGRGALDMKGLTAIHLEILLLLKRLGVALKRDVILAATADEELGGGAGIRWLIANRPELIEAEYALNEGGGFGLSVAGRWLFLCQTAEKGSGLITLRAHGEPGHASVPRENTAINVLAEAVARLGRARLPQHNTASSESLVRALAKAMAPQVAQTVLDLLDPGKEQAAAEKLDAWLPQNRMLLDVVRASLRNTAVPTVLRAGGSANVIPAVAEALVNQRLLPGQTADDIVFEIRQVVGEGIEIEVTGDSRGVEFVVESPLFDIIGQVFDEIEPGSITAPFMFVGGTDSRALLKMGTKPYGLFPTKIAPGEANPLTLAHGNDERISLDNLLFGARVYWEIVQRLCAAR